ncbi:helix-turn-helix domain-containing protein [Sporosarcina contaminans]|uniref:Helix-turn-helix domain-containing protein n=1 Tax=Sporosarcina contaminans TaxID=633403 RepID=A0ABW3U229_9BACL
MAILGKRLKKARENAGYTQMEAAKKLGVSNGTLSGYERNYRDPDTEILNEMADLYDVSVEWLMGRTENPNRSDEEEFQAFASNPKLNHFFRDVAASEEQDQEELRQIWEIIKQRKKSK